MIDQILTWVASTLFILGSALTLATAIGLVRFPDLLARMHAATKPQTLGLAMMMTGMALTLQELSVAWKVALVVLIQLITAPVSAHMLGRAGTRTGKIDSELLVVDELAEDIAHDQAERAKAERERAGDANGGNTTGGMGHPSRRWQDPGLGH